MTMRTSNKIQYDAFCSSHYVPIFSKPWWMDAICGEDNWDVWLCYHGDTVVAAMPYYMENRGDFRYITKAPLTQNNGIIFVHEQDSTLISRQKLEEKIINEACDFIESLQIDVYEQQFHYSFTNWSPFYWKGYSANPRYTYVIEDTSDLEDVWKALSSRHRKNIKKGNKNAVIEHNMLPHLFYHEHEKVFLKQNLSCPFSEDLWTRLYEAVKARDAGKTLYAKSLNDEVASVLFLVWDEQSAYLLLGGSIPGLQTLETYSALVWEGIKLANKKRLSFDFEGSMIKRVAYSYREFGGNPKLYFRIRKVFNPDIVYQEARSQIEKMPWGGGSSL